MNVEAPSWVAPKLKRDVPIGNALRRLFHCRDSELPADFDQLLGQLKRPS